MNFNENLVFNKWNKLVHIMRAYNKLRHIKFRYILPSFKLRYIFFQELIIITYFHYYSKIYDTSNLKSTCKVNLKRAISTWSWYNLISNRLHVTPVKV